MYQTEISGYRNILELDECTVGIHIIRLTYVILLARPLY